MPRSRGSAAVTSIANDAPACEGTYHALGTWGHDGGPARFALVSKCDCGQGRKPILQCAGKVKMMLSVAYVCEDCERVFDDPRDALDIRALPSRTRALEIVPRNAIGAFQSSQRARGFSEDTIRNRVGTVRTVERATDLPMLSLTTEQIVEYLGRPGVKASTRRSNQVAIRAFFDFAVRNGFRADDPSADLQPVRVPRGKPRPFTREQIVSMLNGGAYRKTRAMILLGYYQGFRVSNISRVHGRDLDLSSGSIRVVVKGGKERTLPLHPVIRELAATMPSDDWWFPARKGANGHIGSPSVTNLITLAKLRAGITDPTLTAHSLRHSFATHMIDEGVDVRVIQELMMHESLDSTQIYVGVSAKLASEGIGSLAATEIPSRSNRGSRNRAAGQ